MTFKTPNLPLIRAIDDPGLVATGADLGKLEAELGRLEACWADQDLTDQPSHGQMSVQQEGSYRTEEISHAEYLRDGVAVMRAAGCPDLD